MPETDQLSCQQDRSKLTAEDRRAVIRTVESIPWSLKQLLNKLIALLRQGVTIDVDEISKDIGTSPGQIEANVARVMLYIQGERDLGIEDWTLIFDKDLPE